MRHVSASFIQESLQTGEVKGLKERTSDRPDFQSKETLFQSAPRLKERTGPLTEGMDFQSRDCLRDILFNYSRLLHVYRERERERETERDRETERE